MNGGGASDEFFDAEQLAVDLAGPLAVSLKSSLQGTEAYDIALYSLPSCFLDSFPGIFDFVAGNGICLLAATAPALAEFALSLPPCFLTSIPEVFDFGTGSDFCLPAAISPALSESALPLPFCFLSSMSGVFDLGVGDNGCSPALAEFILPLPSCFLTSIPVIFGFGADSGFSLPAAISESALPLPLCFFDFGDGDDRCLPAMTSPALVEFALPLGSCFLTSILEFVGFSTGNRIGLPISCFSSAAILGVGAGGGFCPALALPSCLPTSNAAIFGVRVGDGFRLPVAIAPVLPELVLPLPS